MDFLILFSLILFLSLAGPSLFKQLGIPYAAALILIGFVLGPYGLGLFQIDSTLRDFSIVGLLFLMFSAGVEIKLDLLKRVGHSAMIVAFLNSLFPFMMGLWVAGILPLSEPLSLPAYFLLGILFMSSSVGIVVPALTELGVFKSDLGKLIVTAVIIQDVVSLIGLTFLLQTVGHSGKIANPIVYFFFIIAFILTVISVVPRLTQKYFKWLGTHVDDVFEKKFRFVLIMLLIVTVTAEFFGLHLIIAAFITGIACSSVVDEHMEEKFTTVGYGVFVPVFFVFIGMETDFSIIFSADSTTVPAIIVGALIFSKILSGFVGALVVGKGVFESAAIGSATIPQLSTTLATAQLGREVGIFPEEMLVSIVILSLVTTSLSPALVKYFLRRQQLYIEMINRRHKKELDEVFEKGIVRYGKRRLWED